ncbi:unnamed protein product [Alternaria alternata]
MLLPPPPNPVDLPMMEEEHWIYQCISEAVLHSQEREPNGQEELEAPTIRRREQSEIPHYKLRYRDMRAIFKFDKKFTKYSIRIRMPLEFAQTSPLASYGWFGACVINRRGLVFQYSSREQPAATEAKE